MEQDSINREEFDRRLQQSTERIRHKRLALEAQTSLLEDLIGRYSAVLERIEAESGNEADISATKREDLRHVLTELAEHTSAMAARL